MLALPGSYQFVRCRQCGLIYLNPQPTWPERALHYSLGYRGYQRLTTATSSLQRQSMQYGLRKRQRLVENHVSQGRLLDVGCGGGDFVHWMRRHGEWRACGLERVTAVARAARDDYAAPIVVGDQSRLGFAAASFDVITLWAVLEHLSDPMQGLIECARLLRPGGLLVVRTVIGESWGACLFGKYWVGFDAPRILFVFSHHTLDRYLLSAGFTAVGAGSVFHDFYPWLWSWRNFSAAAVRQESWRTVMDAVASSSLARVLSFPFFAWQSFLGRNSFVTVVALKD